MCDTPELSVSLSWFNYTGLLPLLKDPDTSITCFLPTSKGKSFQSYVDAWESDPPGRYMWAVLLQHCLLGQSALTSDQLITGSFYSAAYPQSTITFEMKKGSTYFVGDDGDPGRIIKADLRGGKSIIHLLDSGDQYPAIPPPAEYGSVAEFLEINTRTAWEVFRASAVGSNLLQSYEDITVFAPSDEAFNALFQQLRVTKAQLLRNHALVDLITRAHLVDGQALYTGSLLRYPGPLQLNTLAGPLNVTTDLSIFPRRQQSSRSRPAKDDIVLSNWYGSTVLSDYDVGGSGSLAWEKPRFVAHRLDRVLLPANIQDLQSLF